MNNVDAFINTLNCRNQKELMLFFHNLLLSYQNIIPKISFKIPFYYYEGKWICYLNPIKNNGIEFCFNNGFKLSNKQQILESKKRVLVKGISFYSLEDDQKIELLVEVIEEAINLIKKSLPKGKPQII